MGKRNREVSSDSEWENQSGNEGVQANMGEGEVSENIDDNLDSHTKRILNFTRRSMIRGRVITGFGGAEMRELLSILHAQGWTDLFPQGNTRNRRGRPSGINVKLPSFIFTHLPSYLTRSRVD